MSKRKYKENEREGTNAPKAPPATGEFARDDYHWVRHCLTGEWVQESDWTPYSCSVQFDRVFCM